MDTSLSTAAPPGGAPVAPAAGKPAISSDFQTFLRMLTVQMRNQDPLNPIDSADYAVQLATFSGVEQQVQTNDLLRNLAAQVSASGLGQMAGWVGREVRADAPLWFDGTPVDLVVPPAPDAASAELVLRDETGQEVQRIVVDPAGGPMRWNGLGDAGAPLPAGLYSFGLETADAAGAPLATLPVESYAPVTEVQLHDGQIWLTRLGGAEVPVSAVGAVRSAH